MTTSSLSAIQPRWRRTALAGLAGILALTLVLAASQVLGVTAWQTKGDVHSKTSVQNASASVTVDIARPYSFRARVRSPGHNQTVDVNYSVFCVTSDFGSGSRSGEFRLSLTGTSTWATHAIPKPTGTWAECSVSAFTFSNSAGTLGLQVQAKLR
jgi:hypothetical protein